MKFAAVLAGVSGLLWMGLGAYMIQTADIAEDAAVGLFWSFTGLLSLCICGVLAAKSASQ